MVDKKRELTLVHTVRRRYPWFPPGDIVEGEKPDFVLVDGGTRIGLEVTELFQPPKDGSTFGPHVVKKFHEQVMVLAEDSARMLPPSDVLVYFDYRYRLRDARACADGLVGFVRAHRPGTYGPLEGVPHGFSVIRIAEPVANVAPRWRCGDSGETLAASRAMLTAVIAEKNRLVPSYLLRVPRVWLLIACSYGDFANNFYAPSEAQDWRFDFRFDKVLLLPSEGEVLELLRHDG